MSWLSTLSIVETTALLSCLALLLPIVIHLINPSKGRVIWVGNIEIIKKIKRSKANQLKIKRWLLLLLRIIIFGLLALILSGLIKTQEFSRGENQNVLLTPQWLKAVPPEKIKKTIASHSDKSIYLVTDKLVKIDIDNVESSSLKSGISEAVANTTFSQLLEAKLSLKSHKSNLWLYTTDLNLSDAGASLTYIASDVEVVAHQATQPETGYRVLILAEGTRSIDANIMERALSSLLEESSATITSANIDTFRTTENPSNSFDLIVALSSEEFDPVQLLKPKGLYLTDARNDVFSDSQEFLPLSSQIFKVRRSKEENYPQETIVWRTQKQLPLLTKVYRDNYTQLHFYGRFHPEFSSFVENSIFLEHMGKLISQFSPVDSWRVSEQALNKDSGFSEAQLKLLESSEQSLHSWLVFLLCFFWLLERLVAEHVRSSKSEKQLNMAELS